MPSVPACFNLMMQASTSVGKHWGRLGSAISDELASPAEIPFWSVELSKESLFVTEAFSSVVTALLLPFTMPGSVLTMPWLLCCDEFCTFCGEELFTVTLFVPCDPPVVNTMFEETVAEVFFAEEDGEDSMFTMFAFPKLSLFLCFFSFFSFSFSLLKFKSKSLHLYCKLMQVLFTSVLFWWFYVTLVTNWSIGKCLKTSIVETLRRIKNLHVLPRTGLKKRPVQPSGTKNTETHKTDRNPPIASHKSWPFEPVEGNFCSLRWLKAAKSPNLSWLMNFRIRMFMKRVVRNIFVGVPI